MSKDTKNSILIAVLGVMLGVLATLSISGFINSKHKRLVKTQYANWQKLNVILGEIQRNYVDTIDVAKLTDLAVNAVLAGLDPHSSYLPPMDLQQANEQLAGKFYGIGIMFNVPNDTAIVMDVIAGGPAEKVGLLKGDRILKVDGKTIAGVKYPQDSMIFRMKGDLDTKVNVIVKRGKEQIPFEITRAPIPLHSVDVAYMINDSTAYLKLSKYNETTYEEVAKATKDLLDKGMKHLIIDLRGNSGGYFNHALQMANLFLKKGQEIVHLKGTHRQLAIYKADGTGFLQDIGLSVLIDDGSASSSEIFAGAIQDNDRGVLYGRRSFGKGLVQEPINFTDGSGIRLTVSRFYTPSGRCIQKPYSKDYNYDIYKRFADGEMFDKDSIKIDKKEVYKTIGGRTVYGGGGIIPDVFVPIDTGKVTKFFIECNKKTLPLRFASYMFDKHKLDLEKIKDFKTLNIYLDKLDIPTAYLNFAKQNGVSPANKTEWDTTKEYLLPQLRALVGRYSALGDIAFYTMYQPIDNVLNKALQGSDKVKK